MISNQDRLYRTLAVVSAAVMFVLILSTARGASAQSISLPSIDKINFFVHGGHFVGSEDLQTARRADFGWGFETIFQLKEIEPKRVIELAVGYDQLFIDSSIDNYQVRGSIRSLPSIFVYFSTFHNFYAGLGTGIASMTNVFVYDNNKRVASLKGDTFDLAAKIGFITCPIRRVSLFAEAGYHVRHLGGVFYDNVQMPTDIVGLPRSLYFGGISFGAGIQINLTSESKPEAPKCIFEIPEKCVDGTPKQ
jgi:hypothetical protein